MSELIIRKIKIPKFFLPVIVLLFTFFVMDITARNLIKVTGEVTNPQGAELIGVRVYEKSNTKNGVITDINGRYASSQVIHLYPGDDLQKAIDGINTSDMHEDIVIELAGGRYELSTPLQLTSAQSGTNGYRVIMRSAANQLAHISGGVKIENWTIHDAFNNIVKASVTSGFIFRQLYVNDVKAKYSKYSYNGNSFIRANHPLVERIYNGELYWGAAVPHTEVTAKGLSITTTPWNNLQDVEVHFHPTYRRFISSIQAIVNKDNTLSYLFPKQASEVLGARKKNTDGLYDIEFYNAYEFIDEEGEWYLDKSTNTVYYKLNSGESISTIDVIAPKLERLVELNDVENFVMFGLCFEHNTWLYPSTHYLFSEETYFHTERFNLFGVVPGAIHIKNTSKIQFERNIFRFLGGQAILVDDEKPTCNLFITGNVFYENSGGSITLNTPKYNPSTTAIKGAYRPLISNNYFYKNGYGKGMSVVSAHYAHQMEFSNNKMVKAPKMGLGTGHGSSAGNLYRFIIKENVFDSIATDAVELCVYHSKMNSRGSQILRNVFDNTIKVASGQMMGNFINSPNDRALGNIYYDNYNAWATSKGNIHKLVDFNDFRDIGAESSGFHHWHGGTGSPNYIIDDYESSNAAIEAAAGLTSKYIDIKNFANSNPGSIAGNNYPSPMEFVAIMIDDRDPDNEEYAISYTGNNGTGSGSWSQVSSNGINYSVGGYMNTYSQTSSNGDELRISFHGTAIDVLAPKNSSQSTMEVYLDGKLDSTVNLYSADESWQQVVYRVQNLSKGEHLLVLRKIDGVGSKLCIDAFEVKTSGTALEIVQLYPQQGNLNVQQNDSLVLLFNRNVTPIAGKYIKIYTGDGGLFDSIESTSAQVMVNGVKVIIAPSNLLDKDKYYYVLIDSGAFNNEEGDSYWGISDLESWSFATFDENIALNKPSVASGFFGPAFVAGMGNDGDNNSLWSTGPLTPGTNAWWQVDLNAAYKIDNIEIVPRQNLDQIFARKNFRILGSNSNNISSFEVLASHGDTPFADKETWKKSITNNSGFRYLRLEKTDNSSMNFAEFRAYGELATSGTKRVEDVRSKIISYPNPTTNIIYVESDSEIRSIMVFEMNGIMLMEKKCTNRNESISLDNLSPGIYLLKVLDFNGLKKGLIVKI